MPSSRRILEDVNKIVGSLRKIVAAEGCVVHGVNRSGHRWGASQFGAPVDRIRTHGGKRTKSLGMKKFPLHEDALSVETSMVTSYLSGISGTTVPRNPDTIQEDLVLAVPVEDLPAQADTLLEDSALDDVSISSSASTDNIVQEQIARM